MKRQLSSTVSNSTLISIPCLSGLLTLLAMLLFGSHTITPALSQVALPITAGPTPVLIPNENEIQCNAPATLVKENIAYSKILWNYSPKELVTIPNKINEQQAILLKYAYEVAEADGHRDPSILQGLIWQESKAGGYPGYEVAGDEYGLKVGKRYYGIGQIKVAAARDVIRRFPADFIEFREMADEEIIAHLILDQEFNIRVASKYLWMMGHNETKKPTFKRPSNYAITAYNRGLGNTYKTDYDNWHYTVSVHEHKDTFIKTFNLANNLTE